MENVLFVEMSWTKILFIVLWLLYGGGGHEICNPVPDIKYVYTGVGQNARLLWNYTSSNVTMVRVCYQRDLKLQANSNGVCPKGLTSLLTLATDGNLAYMGDTQEDLKLFHKMEFVGQVDIGKLWFVLKNVTQKDFGMRFQVLLRLDDGKKDYADCYHESVPGIHLKADGTRPEPESPSPTTTPTTTPTTLTTLPNNSITAPGPRNRNKKSSQLHVGAIVALVFSIIVAVVKSFEYCKRSSANKTVVWV